MVWGLSEEIWRGLRISNARSSAKSRRIRPPRARTHHEVSEWDFLVSLVPFVDSLFVQFVDALSLRPPSINVLSPWPRDTWCGGRSTRCRIYEPWRVRRLAGF